MLSLCVRKRIQLVKLPLQQSREVSKTDFLGTLVICGDHEKLAGYIREQYQYYISDHVHVLLDALLHNVVVL